MIGRWFSRLRVRLVLLALVPLLPVLVVALVNAQQDRSDANRDVRRNAVSLARLAGSSIEQRLEAARQVLIGLSNENAITGMRSRECARQLARELRDISVYENLAVVDVRGRVVCAARPTAHAGASMAAANWFRAVQGTGQTALGDDLGVGLTRRPALVMATPLRRGDATPAGAVAAVLDLNDLRPIASAIDLPVGGALTAFETDGRVLARFPAPGPFVGRRYERGVIRAGQKGPRGAVEAKGLDGVTRVYGYDRVGVAGKRQIIVSLGLSKDRAQAAADRSLRRTLITLLVVALISVAFALFVANWFIARPVHALASATRRLAAGDLRVRTGVRSGGEVGELAAAFDEMAAALEARERQLDRSAGERQRLLAELIAAEEEERKRIAGDIHDDSIQAMSALLLRLEIIETKLEEGEQRQSLTEAREAAREAVGRLRHLVFKLSPPSLATAGLVPALEIFVEEVSRVWGPAGTVEGDLATEPSPTLRALVYRIASEAVNNAARHARARRIEVSVQSRDGGVWVKVEDDGVGFDVDAARQAVPGHLGLVSMRERAESAGGWWRVTSRPGAGATVEFWVPDREDSEVEPPVPTGDGTTV